MKKINNLNELINLVGKDTLDKCFAEYMMLIIARNNKLEDLEKDLKEMNDTDTITVEKLKDRLE